MKFNPAQIVLPCLASVVLFGFGPAAMAVSATWNGSSSSLWSGTANWSASPVPGTGDTATFNNAGNGNTTIDLGAGVTAATVVFDTTSAAAYTIGSGGVGNQSLTLNDTGALTLGLSAGTAPTASQTINANLTLGTAVTGTTTFTHNATLASGVALNVAGTVTGGTGGTAGTKTLNIAGTGTVNLQGAVNKGGATVINVVNIGTGTTTLSGSGTSALGTLRATASGGTMAVNGQTVTASSSSPYGGTSVGSKFILTSGSAAFNAGIQSATSSGALAGADGMAFLVNGGTFSASSVALGRSFNFSTTGGATVTTAQNMGTSGFQVNNNATATVTGAVNLAGSNSAANGQVSGTGSLTIGGELIIGGTGSSGTTRTTLFQVTGGTLTDTDTTGGGIVLGKGTTTAASGELLLTGGTSTTEKISFGVNAGLAGSFGNLTMNGSGASLYVGSGGIVLAANNAYTYGINLLSGTLAAKANWSSSLNLSLAGSGMTIKAADAADVARNITLNGNLSGANGFTKTGGGILTLGGGNSFSGNTTISAGTVALGSGGTINNSPVISVASGATYDVSAVSGYTLAASQSLRGAGAVSGSVASVATTTLYPGTAGTAATLAFNNNLNLAGGGASYFDLSTSASSGNDKITVGGNLTIGGSIQISALSGAANLDTTADYVLFQVSGTTSGSLPTLVWNGTAPANSANFVLAQVGNNIVLKFSAASAPTVAASASPATATRNQAVTVMATVTPGSGNIASVVANATPIGGSASAALVLSNNFVYTNTLIVSAATPVGSANLTVTVTDDTSPTPLTGSTTAALTIAAANQTWDGGAGDAKWSSNPNWLSDAGPGFSGDAVTFAGSANTSPDMDNNYSVTGVTFDSTAASFAIGTTTSGVLSLSGGVVNNSSSAQTINVPLSLSATQTFDAAAGDLAVSQPISGTAGLTKAGAGVLTLSGANTYNGATLAGAGVLRLNSGGNIAGTTASISAVAGAQLHINGGALSATTGNVGTPSAGLLVSSGSIAYSGGLSMDLGNSQNSVIAVNGGSLSAASLTLGRTGLILSSEPSAGSTTQGFYVNGGTVNVSGAMNMNTSAAANSSVNARIDSGSLTVGGVLTIGLNNGGRWSLMDVNGGSLAVNDATTGISVGGPSAGKALLLVRSGTATAAKITLGQGAVVSESTVRLNGGSLYVGSGGIVLGSSGVGHVTVVNLAGGTLGAVADWSSSLGLTLGNATIKAADAADTARNITLNGALGGGSLTKTGGGTLTLNGANTFTGNTTISAGTLTLGASGSISTSPVIAIGAGATLDVTAFAPWTLQASQKLAGSGTVSGSVQANGTIAPGASIGTLTFATGPTLAGTFLAEINRANAQTADKLDATSGTTTVGGTLTVTNIGPVLVSGDTFDLLDGALSGTFATINLPGGPAHWNTTALHTTGVITYNGNAAPVASSFSLGVVVGGSVTTPVVGKYVSDVDGDAVTITAVSTPANGTATIVGGTNITYTSTSAAASDSFTYTVSDALGGTDTRTVTVVISSPQGFNLISGPTPVGGGQYQFDYLGIPGQQYAIEETASIAPPITWTPVDTNTAAGNGALSFTITPSNPSGFFRTRSLP